MTGVRERIKGVRIYQHKTAARCWRRYWHVLSDKEFSRCAIYGQNEAGKRVRLRNDHVIRGLEAMGMWGFAETKKRTVHYWHDGKRSEGELAYLLGHEVAHIVYPDWPPKLAAKSKAHKAEEFVDRFGAVAMFVHEYLARSAKG